MFINGHTNKSKGEEKYFDRSIANTLGSTFAFLANTLSPTKNAKELPSQRTGTHPASLDTEQNLTDQEEGRTHNMGFAKIRADGSYLRLFVILLCFISGWTLSI